MSAAPIKTLNFIPSNQSWGAGQRVTARLIVVSLLCSTNSPMIINNNIQGMRVIIYNIS